MTVARFLEPRAAHCPPGWSILVQYPAGRFLPGAFSYIAIRVFRYKTLFADPILDVQNMEICK